MNHGLGGFGVELVVQGDSPEVVEPGERPFDNPPQRDDIEFFRAFVGSEHDLKPAFVITGGAAFYIPILVFFFLMRFGSQMIIYHKATKRLGEKGLLPGLIAYDFVFAFLTPFFRLMGRMNFGAE